MKEQAQLREEMAYQYKIGNFEVSIVNMICSCCVISNNFESSYSLIPHYIIIIIIGRSCYSEKIGPGCCDVKTGGYVSRIMSSCLSCFLHCII
jgi:hypothetical protein